MTKFHPNATQLLCCRPAAWQHREHKSTLRHTLHVSWDFAMPLLPFLWPACMSATAVTVDCSEVLLQCGCGGQCCCSRAARLPSMHGHMLLPSLLYRTCNIASCRLQGCTYPSSAARDKLLPLDLCGFFTALAGVGQGSAAAVLGWWSGDSSVS